MFLGCGLCNGVTSPGPCPVCANHMEDLGMVEDYDGPYSPYQDGELIEWQHREEKKDSLVCIHLVQCPECKHYDYMEIPL